ncbi:MAG TPA: TolC family protein [Gammaproteobacteria bacterium]
MHCKRWLAASCCALALAAPAAAVTVDLDQAVELALQADPRISEREHLVEAARALLQEAVGSDGLFLDLDAFLALSPGVDDGFFNTGKTCNSPCKVNDDGMDGVSPWANVQFKLIKPLLTFGKIESYAEAAQGNVDVKRGDVRLQRIETRMQVSKAYYGYLAARNGRELLEDVDARVNKAINLVQRWIEEGTGNAKQSDLFAMQTGRGLLRKALAQARAIEQIALAGLRLLTGIPANEPLEVAERNITAVPLPIGSLEELQAKALVERTEIDQLEAGLRARRALVEAKRAEMRPNVYAGVVGSLAWSPERETLDSPYVHDPFNHAGASPVVGMQWRWAGNVQQARIAQAEAELNALVDKQSFARAGIPFEVTERYHQVLANQSAVEELAQASRAGRRWMLTSYADFEAGIERSERVIAAFQGYVLAHTDYLASLNDYNMEVAELLRVSGSYR